MLNRTGSAFNCTKMRLLLRPGRANESSLIIALQKYIHFIIRLIHIQAFNHGIKTVLFFHTCQYLPTFGQITRKKEVYLFVL